jgi:Domain of unknown function (DUF5667)
MSVRRPNQLSDELDAVLDGRPVEISDDLAPLIEAAAELRAALEAVELDPDAAERHLGRVLDGQATVLPLPVRPQPQANPWRRRVAAVALAAALTVVPAAMASASTMPGDVLYPMKLAVEQLRVAAAFWSDTAEASERMRIAHARMQELDGLFKRGATDRIPAAADAVAEAVEAADDAVDEALRDDGGEAALALKSKLEVIGAQSRSQILRALQSGSYAGSQKAAIEDALEQVQTVTPTTVGTPLTTDPTSTSILTSSTTPAGGTQTSSSVSTSTTETTTTTTVPTTTTTPTTTTAAPATTAASQTTAAPPEEGGTEASGAGDLDDPTGTTAP